MPEKVWEEWRRYVDWAPGEVSVYGLVYLNGNEFFIPRIFLLEQENTGSNTEISQAALAMLMVQLDEEGIDLTHLAAWIHSHGQIQVFWSGTDETNIENLGNTAGYIISIVSNKKGEYKVRLDVYSPIHLTVNDLLLHIEEEVDEEWERELREDFKRKTVHNSITSDHTVVISRYEPPLNPLINHEEETTLFDNDETAVDFPLASEEDLEAELARIDSEMEYLSWRLRSGDLSVEQFRVEHRALVKKRDPILSMLESIQRGEVLRGNE